MQIVHYQAKLTDAEIRVSDAEDQVSQARGELGATQSECIRLKRTNETLNEELARDALCKS